jgi:hypothetical protein
MDRPQRDSINGPRRHQLVSSLAGSQEGPEVLGPYKQWLRLGSGESLQERDRTVLKDFRRGQHPAALNGFSNQHVTGQHVAKGG